MRWLLLLLVMVSGPASASEPLTADALARGLLDGEALYTVSGGLKPVSDGFWHTRFPASQDTSSEVDEAKRLLATLPLGPDLEVGVFVFAATYEGKKSASAFVAHKPSLRALVNRRADVFGPLGVTADTPPQQVMEKIDRGPRSARWRAFGLAFGYPEYAVEFFVSAGEEQALTGKFVARDFVNIPTFDGDRGRFVYAVPKGHTERTEDCYLKAMSGPILTRYRAWREVYLQAQEFGAVELLRNWIAPPIMVGCMPANQPETSVPCGRFPIGCIPGSVESIYCRRQGVYRPSTVPRWSSGQGIWRWR
jgi:hypothetical protein